MLAIIKQIINKIKYQRLYPGCRVSSLANLAPNVLLAKGSSIDNFASISSSSLGEGTAVHSHCSLVSSSLGERTTVHSNCSLDGVLTEHDVALYDDGIFKELQVGCHSYIAPNATISMATIGRFCSIESSVSIESSSLGERTTVHSSCSLASSSLGEGATVHSHCFLASSSLGKGATVHSSCSLASSSLGEGTTVHSHCSFANSSLGEGTTVHSHCSLDGVVTEHDVALYDHGIFQDLQVGCYSYIAPNAAISMATIGRFCSIGPYLICGCGDHPVDWPSISPVFFSTMKQCGKMFADKNLFEERKPIEIGHDVWIGARVFIRDGVKIGHGAILAAGAVVVKDVPDYAIVGGVPAKIIRYRFSSEVIAKLLDMQWWNWPEETLREAQPYFVQNDMEAFMRWENSCTKSTT